MCIRTAVHHSSLISAHLKLNILLSSVRRSESCWVRLTNLGLWFLNFSHLEIFMEYWSTFLSTNKNLNLFNEDLKNRQNRYLLYIIIRFGKCQDIKVQVPRGTSLYYRWLFSNKVSFDKSIRSRTWKTILHWSIHMMLNISTPYSFPFSHFWLINYSVTPTQKLWYANYNTVCKDQNSCSIVFIPNFIIIYLRN